MLEIARLTQRADVDLGIDFSLWRGNRPPEYDKTHPQTMNSYCLGSQYYCKHQLLTMNHEIGVFT